MKIEKITLENFRCFGPEPTEIWLDQVVTAFVGNNGSGKTSIFDALGKLFGTTKWQRTVRKSDFHCASDQSEIEDGTELSVDCILAFPEMENGEEDDAVPDVFSHMTAAGEGCPLKARIRLVARWIDNGTPEGTVEEEIKWVTTLEDDFVWDQCRRIGAVERNFVQLVYVPASRNASDQVANLLKGRLWRAAQWSDELDEAVSSSSHALQRQFDGEDAASFISERIERRWRQVHYGDTDAHAQLRLIEGRLDDLIKRAEFAFFPDEADHHRRLDDLSDGQRSLFHIALTAATLEIEHDALASAPDESVFDQQKLRRTYLTILALEEPENSLAPFFLSRTMEMVRQIGAMQGAQCILSSHSPSILSRIEPEEVRYVRLNAETRQSQVNSLTLPDPEEESRRYVRLAVRAYPELYFARLVVLGEGESESIVIPRIAEELGLPLDSSFIPIVPLGGRFVSHFWRLLEDLDIPYVTLLDLDLGRRHGGAATIKYVVDELAAVGRDLSNNPLVVSGEVDLDDLNDIDEGELLEQDQEHDWIQALRHEGVFFSSPIDLDFAMLFCLGDAYQQPRPGGHGPQTTPVAIQSKKQATLKAEGNPDLFDEDWDDAFVWYAYHFIGGSKPEAHLGALSKIANDDLVDNVPDELSALVHAVRDTVFG